MLARRIEAEPMTNAGKRTLGFVLGLPPMHPLATQITGNIRTDSRDIRPGDVFFARSGAKFDGREFINAALEKGAQAVVIEDDNFVFPRDRRIIRVSHFAQTLGAAAARAHGDPSAELRVIGVTGTNGKTTVAHLIAQALNRTGVNERRCGLIGTLGIGWPDALDDSLHTTPEVTLTQSALAEFLRDGADAAVMEVSSHGISQGRTDGVRFDTAVFTNLSRDHLDYHASMEEYGEMKARLFLDPAPAVSIVNIDDSFGAALLARCGGERIAISLDASAKPCVGSKLVHASVRPANGEPVRLCIGGAFGTGVIHSQLLGAFNAYNLLAAAAALMAGGMSLADACERLSAVPPVAGRMQWVGGHDAPMIVVDYSHTPDALENALGALKPDGDARLWCVFGCGGDRDAGKRPLMASVSERFADRIIVTDDNPRTEESSHIIRDIVAGFARPGAVSVIPDRADAIDTAVRLAAPGDVVLIAGKGHERYQERNGVRTPFNDLNEARNSLMASADATASKDTEPQGRQDSDRHG